MLEILKKIKEYQKIIIHRHSNPDLDALGSQIGLKEALKLNFPEKEIYAVGDMNRFTFLLVKLVLYGLVLLLLLIVLKMHLKVLDY